MSVLLPLALIAVIFIHILALHEVGSNNPDGVDVKKFKDEDGVPLDTKPFFPYDIMFMTLYAIGVFLDFLLFHHVLSIPDGGGYVIEYVNYEPADNLKTPDHILFLRMVLHAVLCNA